MSKHTPGPLSVRSSYTGSSHWHVDSASHQSIAVFKNHEDAALFSMATDLLEALEEIAGLIEQDNQTAHEIAVTAIAKARGEA